MGQRQEMHTTHPHVVYEGPNAGIDNVSLPPGRVLAFLRLAKSFQKRHLAWTLAMLRCSCVQAKRSNAKCLWRIATMHPDRRLGPALATRPRLRGMGPPVPEV